MGLGVVTFLCLIIAGVYWILAGFAETNQESVKEDKFNLLARVFLVIALVIGVSLLIRIFVFKL